MSVAPSCGILRTTMSKQDDDDGSSWTTVVKMNRRRRQRQPDYASLFSEVTHLNIEDYNVSLDDLQTAIRTKHFVQAPISAEKALIATKKRHRSTSGGDYNTVFEEPSHMVRISFQDKGVRAERYVSPRHVDTFQCFLEETADEWRAAPVDPMIAVFSMENHLDKDKTLEQLRTEDNKKLGVGLKEARGRQVARGS